MPGKDPGWWVQPWVPHVVTILVLLVGQFFGFLLLSRQNKLQVDTQVRQELWKVKYEAYRDALDLVTKHFYSIEWPAGSARHKFPGPRPTAEEYGRVYSRLRLLTDSPSLVGTFLRCLGVEGRPDGSVRNVVVHTEELARLAAIMRLDLGAKPDPTPPKDFALIDFLPIPLPTVAPGSAPSAP